MLARVPTFLSSLLVCLGLDINFSSKTFISNSNFPFQSCVGIQWVFLSLCHPTNILRSGSWLMPSYRGNQLQSIRLCPFWERPSFVPMDICNFASYAVIHSYMLNVYHSPAHFFLSFCLSLPALHLLQRMSQLQQSLVPL